MDFLKRTVRQIIDLHQAGYGEDTLESALAAVENLLGNVRAHQRKK